MIAAFAGHTAVPGSDSQHCAVREPKTRRGPVGVLLSRATFGRGLQVPATRQPGEAASR